jgi:hypothetical protein
MPCVVNELATRTQRCFVSTRTVHAEDLLNSAPDGRLTVENAVDFSTLAKPEQKKLIDGG